MDQRVSTWGYKPDGSAQIFELARSEGLPDGWHASPDCISDPALASAEALTARSEGRFYVPPVSEGVVDEAVATSLDAGLVVEIERLKAIIETGSAENLKLGEDVELIMAENDALELHAAELKADLDRAVVELTDLKDLLVKAQADGGFAVSERDAALASIATLQDELLQAKADLDAATTPVPAVRPGKAR